MGNVFRSVLASARALLQNKTVTAGTSNISVQADSGYDGLDTVTVQPTPTETGSATPTTSSQTISPSSGKHLSSVTVEAIPSEYVIPTDITPSNSSPVALTSGSAYKPDASGYAISSYSSVSPSSSPTTLSSDNIYKMSSGGYAINSYSSSSKTPSSSGAYFSSGWNYMNSSGYAYSSQPSGTKGAKGSFTATQLANTITCGFEPKTIAVIQHNSNMSIFCTYAYSQNASSSYATGGRYKDSSTNTYSKFSVPTSTTGISAISSTGFSINANSLTNYGNIIDWFATE